MLFLKAFIIQYIDSFVFEKFDYKIFLRYQLSIQAYKQDKIINKIEFH